MTSMRPARARFGAAVVVTLVWMAGTTACGGLPRAHDVVVVASGADLESANPLVTIHPLARQVQRHALLVTLARYDSLLSPEPYLARRWSWSADGRELTFHLFAGLRWHDGASTTAHDVAFTIDAARDPATGFPRAAELASVNGVDAIDDSTVVVRFAQPPADFPLVFCELPIVPRHLLGNVPRSDMRRAAYNLEPVGNGPFRFVSRSAGSRWVFERNADFPLELGGAPHIRRFVVAVVDEATTKFAGLVSGELDVAGIAPTQASLVSADPRLQVLTYPVLFSTGIVFNIHRPPFDDPRVRRAIDLSIRRDRIIDAAFAGLALPAAGPVHPASPYALPDSAVRDAELADSLLDAAGWRLPVAGRLRERDGVQFRFELLTVGSADNAVEQLIQADLAERRIRMEIRQLELGAFLTIARGSERRFDALITGIPGDPSLAYLAAMYDSRLRGGALDYAGYHRPELDRLFDAARTAPDVTTRREHWQALQRELARETPAAWVFHSRGVQGLSRRLQGVTMDLRGELVSLSRWRVEAPAALAATARP